MGSSILFHLSWFRNGMWHNSGQWNMRWRPWGILRLFPSLYKSSQDSGLSSFPEARMVAAILGPQEQPASEEKPTHWGGRAEGRKETKFFKRLLRGWINSSCPLKVTTILIQWTLWCHPDSFFRTKELISSAIRSTPSLEITFFRRCLTPNWQLLSPCNYVQFFS